MIEGDHDHVAPLCQPFAVVGTQFLAGTGHKSPAMEPNHDRPLLTVVHSACPEVYAQAVFIGHAVVPGKHPSGFVTGPALSRRLRADITELHRAACARPGCRL